jgi:hypothetical protein
MKYSLYLILFNLIFSSCDKEKLEPCDINQKLVNSMADVEKNIEGKWNLTEYTAGRAPQAKPKLEIEFTKGSTKNEYVAQVFEDKKAIGNVTFAITERTEEKNLILTSDQKKLFTNDRYNFFYGNFRICQNQLMIDNGGIFDAPVFIFDKE